MKAGVLEIDMIANVARMVQDVQQAQRAVTGSMGAINSAVGTAMKGIEALGVTLSLGAMVLFTDRTLNAIARMKDLGQEAGTSASAMSKFEGPARKAGSSLDDVATAMFRMGKAAKDAQDPSNASAIALNSIGISTSQLKGLKPDEMFELIARKLEGYSDGLGKNAVLQQLFGKSGKEMNGIMHAIAEQSQLTATVTDEQAAAAKKLEEQMVELKMTSDRYWRSLISDAVPALNEALKSFMENRKELGFFAAAMDAILNMGKGGSSLEAQLANINQQISLAKRATDIEKGGGGIFDFASPANAAAAAKLNDLLKQRADIEHLISEEAIRQQDARLLAGAKGKPDPNFDPAAIAAAKAAQEAYKGVNAQLDQEIANLKGVGEMDAFIDKLEESKFSKLSADQLAELINKKQLLIDLKNEAAARQLIIESDKALIEAMQKLRDLESDAIANAAQSKADMEFEIAMIGKTSAEVEKLTALRQADLDLRKQAEAMDTGGDSMSAEQGATLARLVSINDQHKVEIGRLKDIKAAATDNLAVWSDLGDRVGQFFSDMVTNGGSAIDKLRSLFKSLLADMIRIFARRWILDMAAGGTVMGSAGSALATTTGGGAGSSLLGTAVNAAGSYVGTAALGYVGMGAAGVPAATGMVGAAAADSLAINAAAGSYGALSGAAGALSGVYTALAAIPVWGWIAMAVIAIGAWIAGNHKGGPKFGGSAFGSVDDAGTFVSGGAVPGTDNGRFFTPDQMDPQMQALVAATAKGFAGTLASLGVKPGGAFTFGLGADNDPQGTAQSRVSALLKGANGQVLYSNLDQNMDDKAVPAALQLESERMILAALQASDLPEYLSKVFDGLTPSSATEDQINAAIQQAQMLKSIFDIATSNPLDAAAQMLTDSLNPLDAAMRQNRATISAVMNAYDGSSQAATNLQQATVGYYNAQVQLIAGIENTKRAIDDMFGGTFRSIQMAGLDKQGKYDFLQKEAADLQAQALASTDPATIQALSQRINDDISAAFNLLSPEEQAAQGGAFLAKGHATQDAIDAHMEAVKKGVVDATNDMLQKLLDKIGASDEAQKAAAEKQDDAADKNLTAAKTPRLIIIQGPNGQQTVTFSDTGG